MSSLFYPARFASGNAGAKLYFYITNTTTPQNTYQDSALATPHANPVVADAAGLFPAIFFDPTLPDYRVRYTTSADVLIYQTDGVASAQSVSTEYRIESTAPSIVLYDTDGTVNQRKYRISIVGSDFRIGMLNDAESSENTLLYIQGGVLPRLTLTTDTTIDDGLVEYSIAYVQTGNYTGTLTGYAAPPTGAISWSKIGDKVDLVIRSAADGFTGTSNSTSMTITGMPTVLLPQREQVVPIVSVVDNGNYIGDGEGVSVRIATNGTITFLINGSATGFTNSGTKSTGPGCTISYITS